MLNVEPILCVTRINQHYPQMSRTEKKIADVILNDCQKVMDLSASQLAKLADVSPATIVRFFQGIGYTGMTEFKMHLNLELLSPYDEWMDVKSEDSVAVIMQKTSRFNQAAIDDTQAVMGSHIKMVEKAVNAIDKARKVLIIAEGGSGATSRCAYDTFLKINLDCELLEDPVFQILACRKLKKGDVAFTICHSGRTRNTIETMKHAASTGATTVAIIGSVGTPLEKVVDIPLYTGSSTHSFFSETIAAHIGEMNVLSTLHTILTLRNKEQLGDYRERIIELLELRRVP